MNKLSELMLHVLQDKIVRVEFELVQRARFTPNAWECRQVAVMDNGDRYEVSTRQFKWSKKEKSLTLSHDIPFNIELKHQ